MKTSRRDFLAASGALVAASLPLASQVADAGRASRFPNPNWPQTTDLQSAGTSQERLAAYDSWLREHAGISWASVVIMDGYLVYEGRGARSTVHQKNDCGSITKPLYSTVLGVALYQHKLKSLDENAIPYWKDPFVTPYAKDKSITFREFASYHDRWNEDAPSGTFHYNNGGATAAAACIAGLFTDVHGTRPEGMAQVAKKEVADKIGADWDLWYWQADFLPKPGNSGPQMVLESSVYELAKLGYLWLNRGRWKNTRIFSEEYFHEATTDWSPDTGNTEFGYYGHYGFWWFINDRKVLLPDAPADTFYVIGYGEPKRATCLMVIPSMDMVAVLSMERLSDDGKWDVIKDSRSPSDEGPRLWGAEVAKLSAVGVG
jgi:CubicO group peptidase (beta-lactamase class C family)